MVLKGPIPTEVEAAMEQSYEVKGSRDVMEMEVCELGTLLWTVNPLPVSVMLMV